MKKKMLTKKAYFYMLLLGGLLILINPYIGGSFVLIVVLWLIKEKFSGK